jgi:CheY-like chemotaxis protein
MQAEEAASAAAGRQKFEESVAAGRPFRVVLLDKQMPDLGGLELVAQASSYAEIMRKATILMLDSVELRTTSARCRELGLGGYVTKPVRAAELLDAVCRVLGTAREAAPAPSRKAHAADFRLHILIAEDNPVNQRLAVALLEKAGHTVTLARDGVEAVKRWKEGGIDVILMDVQMPELDGLQATQRIRQEETVRGGHVPIVAMTAGAMSGDRERCLKMDMDGYLSKPINRHELLGMLARVGDRRAKAQNSGGDGPVSASSTEAGKLPEV